MNQKIFFFENINKIGKFVAKLCKEKNKSSVKKEVIIMTITMKFRKSLEIP